MGMEGMLSLAAREDVDRLPTPAQSSPARPVRTARPAPR